MCIIEDTKRATFLCMAIKNRVVITTSLAWPGLLLCPCRSSLLSLFISFIIDLFKMKDEGMDQEPNTTIHTEAEEYESDLDLHQDYLNAVDCLMHYDALFTTFQEQIRSKEQRIHALEDKIMALSLELASVKAGLDYLKLKRPSGHGIDTSTSLPNTMKSWPSPIVNLNSTNQLFHFGQLMDRTLRLLPELKHRNTDDAVDADADAGNKGGGVEHDIDEEIMLPKSFSRKNSDALEYNKNNNFKRSHSHPHRLYQSRSSETRVDGPSNADFERVISPVCSVNDRISSTNSDTRIEDEMKHVEWPTF